MEHRVRRARLSFAAASLSLLIVSLAQVANSSTWDGGGGSSLWSDPLNWNPDGVPCNGLLSSYSAVIPGVFSVSQDVASCEVDSLVLANNSTLSLASGTSLEATTCALSGILSGVGGAFTCPSAGAFAGTRASASAASGSIIDLGATSYSSAGLTGTTQLLATSGTSQLLLGDLSSIDAGFNDGSAGASQHYIYANGGTIDLSGLASVITPVRAEDYFRFLTAAGGSILLTNLATTSSSNPGFTYFEAAGGTIALPALGSANKTVFDAHSSGSISTLGGPTFTYSSAGFGYTAQIMRAAAGSALTLPTIQTINAAFDDSSNGESQHYIYANGGAINLSGVTSTIPPLRAEDYLRFVASSGGTFDLSDLATVSSSNSGYTSFEAAGGTIALPALGSASKTVFDAHSGGSISTVGGPTFTYSSAGFGGTVQIMRATAGSTLTLPTIQTLNAAFNDASTGASQHYIYANGGVINLSGVTSTIPPLRAEDYLRFVASSGGTFNLSNLATVSSSNSGYTSFEAAGGTIALPALGSANKTVFDAHSGGSISTLGGPTFAYSSAGFGHSAQIMRATAGSALTLPTIQTINAAFDDASTGASQHYIYANAGAINLSGVTTVLTPIRAEDYVRFVASGGGSIDLAALDVVATGGSGTAKFEVDSSTLTIGDLHPTAATTLSIGDSSAPATVNVLGEIRSVATTHVAISGAESQLVLGEGLTLDGASELDMAEAVLRVSGDVDYAEAVNATSGASDSSIRMEGTGTQRLEVGGPDLGVPTGALTASHFAIGQLVVDGASGPLEASLRCDEAGTGDAGFYLPGLNPAGELAAGPLGANGLRLLDGATLSLGGADVYARIAGDWVYLNSLVAPGGFVAFDGGFLVADDGDGDGFGDGLDNCPSVANGGQEDFDGDFVGDACDNCRDVPNPRVGCAYLRANPWATLTGGQRDDDNDGYGNQCDGNFIGPSTELVGPSDLAQYRSASGKSRELDVCGVAPGSTTQPCAIYDLTGADTLIGPPDLAAFRGFSGKLPGPKCAACPLACEPGAKGSCGP